MSDMRNGFIILIVLSVFLGGCIFLPPKGTPSNGHFTSWEPEGWKEAPEDDHCMLSTILFVNKKLGLAGGHALPFDVHSFEVLKTDSACIWRTDDGGYHWRLIRVKGEDVEKFMEKDGVVYAVILQSYTPRTYGIWESRDLGLTWQMKGELSNPYGISFPHFRDSLHGIVYFEIPYTTSDGGKTWQGERWLGNIYVKEVTDSLVYGVLRSDPKVVGCWNYVTRREVFRTELPYSAIWGIMSNGFLALEHDKRLKVYRLGADNRYHLLKGCNYKADWVNYIRHEDGHVYLVYNLNFDNKLLYSGDGGRTWQRRRTWSSIINYCTYYEPDTLHLWYSRHTDMGHFKN